MTSFTKQFFLLTIALLLSKQAEAQVIWSSPAGTAWMTGSNWSGGVIPSPTDIAQFNVNPVSATTGVGINMDTASGSISVAAISIGSSRTNNLLIGNSSTNTPGVVTLTGATVNGIPNVFISNYAGNFSKLTIQNTQGSGGSTMSINLGSAAGNMITDAGTTTLAGNTISINTAISGTGPLTFLGNGTWDAATSTGNNGGILRLSSATANTFSGGITVGNNTGTASGILELDVAGAINNTTGNDITINANSQLYLAATSGTTYTAGNTTLNLNGNGNGYNVTGKGALVNLSGGNYTWTGNVNLATDAGITVLGTTSNTLTVSGNMTGSGQLIKEGPGNLILSGTNNNWTGGTQITNGKVIVPAGSKLSDGPIVMAQVLNNPILLLSNTVQNISSLSSGSFAGANNSNNLILNGTRLIINQNINTIYGGPSSTLTSMINGSGSILKTGTGTLTLTSPLYGFTGGLNIAGGEIRFNPAYGGSATNSSADTLSGGTLSTEGISRNFTLSLGTLALAENSTIALGTDSVHFIKFSGSSGITWTPGKTLMITNWRGSWNGTSGAKGKIFVGTSVLGLIASQLAQIKFTDTFGNVFNATMTSPGEVVPAAPTINTTSATFGPFCNNIDNFMSVSFTSNGPLTGIFKVQLSDASGAFASDFYTNIIGSGTTSPITATIPSGTPAGTGYRLRVIDSLPVATFGSNNGTNIVINGTPVLAPITGPSFVQRGGSIALGNTTSGGVWSSVSPTIATINTSGTVTGLTLGTATISYAYTNFCGFTGYASKVVTVIPSPSITSVTPNIGIPGTTVTITGNNFNATLDKNIIYFGAVKAIPTSGTTNSLLVTVPQNAGYACVSVTDTAFGLTSSEQYAFTPTYTNTGLINDSINFKPRINFTSGTTPVGVAIGDLDGDGKPDMVVVNSGPNNIYVYKNVSSAATLNASSFSAPIIYPTGNGPHYIKIADLDGDGRPEIVVTNTSTSGGGNSISVFRNTSTATAISFAAKVDISASSTPIDLSIADIDNDGKPDIAVVLQGSSKVLVLHNATLPGNINNSSFSGTASYNTGIYPFRIFTGDLDGDGKPDMAVTNYFSNTVSVFHNNAVTGAINATTFSAAISLSAGLTPTAIAGADIDGDGKTDLVVTNLSDSSISVFRNTNSVAGTISFGPLTSFRTDSLPEDISIADVNGDGKLDIAVGNYGVNKISIYRNTATSGSITATSLSAKTDLATGTNPAGIAWSDLDGDGKPDIVIANGGSSSVSILKNYPIPPNAPIIGDDSICLGTNTTLTSAVSGGIWISKNPAIATISSSGVVNSVAQGIDTIYYYTIAQGDTNTSSFVIHVEVYSIVGSIVASGTTVCAGASVSLSNAAPHGIWNSSNNTIATVDTNGFVTAHVPGNVVIGYTISTSCGSSNDTVHISVVPAGSYVIGSITGPATLCNGSTVTLSDTSSGGHWSSSNNAVAATNAITGHVTGTGYGSALITYALSNSCGIYHTTTTLTVDTALDASITGADTVCQGMSVTLSSVSSITGTWSSSNSNATVSATGNVTGVNTGSAIISFTLSNVCGSDTGTRSITVNAAPNAGAISGLTAVCPSNSITLSSSLPGGVWSRSNAKATVSATGVVTGNTAGIDTIRYIVTNGCGMDTASQAVTVLPLAYAGSISGLATVCVGSSITLRDTVTGGVWSSLHGLASTSDSIITGLTPGIDTISFTVTNSCNTATTTKKITVVAVSPVDTIAGLSSVCTGASISLTNAVDSGTWSKTNNKANVSATGVVTGVSVGIDTIKYTAKGACPMVAMKAITIKQAPPAGTITGPSSVCVGDSIILRDTASGGIWSGTNVNSTVIDSFLVGLTPGVDTVKYSILTSQCGVTSVIKKITINPQPYAAPVTGANSLYVGDIIVLKDSTAGGIWGVVGKNAIVTVDGKVGGLKEGRDTIKYSITNTCGTYVSRFPITILSSENPETVVDVKLFPNPNTGKFTIYVASKIDENVGIVIANPAYQVINAFTTTTNKNVGFDVDLADGVYFLSAVSKQGWYTVRFVIAR